LHAADGGKDIDRRAAELCGGALSVPHFEKKRKGEKFRIVNQSAKSS